MVCESCGEKPKNTAKDFTKAVIEINNPEALVLLRKVVIPTSMGDEESVPPAIGKYRNVLLQYAANDHIYLYSSDGIPTSITANIPQEILDQIAELEATDVVLQQEIDDIKNSPDVVDIVPTYAALQAYDTSKLGDNDIIRVLADETHDGQSTYYRWNATTSSWTYIGAVGDYYTKTQVDNLIATAPAFKPFPDSVVTNGTTQQFMNSILALNPEVGTAYLGTVSLSDMPTGLIQEEVEVYVYSDYVVYCVMRSTDVAPYSWWCASYNYQGWKPSDTTYSAFTGATTLQAGTSGLVPAPTTSDPDKYLKGDGTWATPPDTTYTAGTNVQISSGNVISATDTTYSNFTGTDGQTAGTAGLVPAPATTDAGKFLKADGTWDTAGGGGGGTIVLTSADYNWNSSTGATGTPNCINLSLLDTGIYQRNDASVVIKDIAPAGADNKDYGTFIVSHPTSSSNLGAYVIVLGDNDWNGSPAWYYTYNSLHSLQQSGKILFSNQVVNDLTTTANNRPLSAGQGKVLKDLIDSLVIKNAGAPTTATVGTVGQLLEDTTNGKLYICTAVTPGTAPDPDTYTWTEVGAGGSSVTVVQTTGTSQTDVMSQNAVTSMVFADPSTAAIVRIGNTNTAQSDSVSIGSSAWANAGGSVSVGAGANTGGSGNSVAVGNVSRCHGKQSVAIGYNAGRGMDGLWGAISLGASSGATHDGEMHIGTSDSSIGYNSSNYRLLTGLYDAQSDHDAVTLGQLNGRVITNAGVPTTATVGTVGQLLEDTTNGKLYICTAVDATDPNTPVYTWTEVGAGGGGTTEIEYVNCTLTGATATGFTLSADKTATQVKALVESGKEVIYKFVNSVSSGSVLAGTYEFSVLYAGTNTSVDVVTGYGITVPYGATAPDIYTFLHTSSNVTVTANTVPTVNDATLTIQKNGTTVQTFTANASSNATANIEVPTITMTTTDPGEGSALAADNFVAVYGGDPIILDYSTSEINTGATWINGKPIYKKTIGTGALPNTTTKNVAHGISNLDLVIDIKGCAWDGSSTWLPIPNAGSSSAAIEAYVYSSNISITTGMDRSGFTTSYVTLYYTKSA